jgi:cytochrome c556
LKARSAAHSSIVRRERILLELKNCFDSRTCDRCKEAINLKRSLLAAVFALVTTWVVAQDDPITARKMLMRTQGGQAALAVKMIRGDEPFDSIKAETVLKTFLETAQKFGDLFPENSQDTLASSTIWTDRAGFNAALAKFSEDVRANQQMTKSLDEFRGAINVIGKDCDACHDRYRTR